MGQETQNLAAPRQVRFGAAMMSKILLSRQTAVICLGGQLLVGGPNLLPVASRPKFWGTRL